LPSTSRFGVKVDVEVDVEDKVERRTRVASTFCSGIGRLDSKLRAGDRGAMSPAISICTCLRAAAIVKP
jgi:hypothetical protein